MTWILVGLMFINGQLNYHFSLQPSRNACEQAALAARANSLDSTVLCVSVPGQPT